MTHRQIYLELMKKLEEYHPSDDFGLITKVYEFALKAHGKQLRKSGEPYIIHPMSVALILAEIRSDIETIAAGILHDVVEDTPYGYETVKELFGKEIAELVQGVTKLKDLKYISKEEEQAENFRQLFFSMSNDIRVILIKMCDRLHNLRTLEHMSREHQIKKAKETIEIYAPLAHRLGISKIRYSLEDLSFKYMKPEEYNDLSEQLKTKLNARQKFISDTVQTLKDKFEEEGITAKVAGRAKHLFSIYKKMKSQNKTIDEIFDILAVRIIVEKIEDCYTVLGIIHGMYTPIPGRIKDYIAIPKANNYRSLHTTVLRDGSPFEVQIRTFEMHEESEFGIAAHWKYKQRKGGMIDPDSEEAKFAWLRHIIEWQMDMADNKEYLSTLKDDLNIYRHHVYCFTPRGEVFNLLNGSTPIDFAYAIHTAVGNKMVGARVNGVIVPLEYVLKNGDQVEILTSNNSRGPSRDWMSIVKTAEARNKINQWFRRENKEENIIKGKELLVKEASKKKFDAYDLLSHKTWLQSVFDRYGMSELDALYAAVGHGGIKEGQIINRLLEERQKEINENQIRENPQEAILQKAASPTERDKGANAILIQGQGGMSVRLSKCCHPIPGDEIVAFVTRGRGVTVHRTDCQNVLAMPELDRSRLVEAQWGDPSAEQPYLTDIRVLCKERNNIIIDISRALTEIEGIKVVNFSARNLTGEVVVTLSIEIHSKEQLDKISVKLNNIPGVYETTRISAQ
ncbi:(p)ppGpp synthetase [Clostridia bacterium]|nr:(p)ppGpp synthetase [Clostridia bacterium]